MEELRTAEHVVAFIDILGASEMIRSDPDKTLNMVHKRYEQSIGMFEKLFGKLKEVLQVRIFSDNIVIICQSQKIPPLEALKLIVMLTSIIQINFLNDDILLRGGITKGNLFADDIMLWGNALVQAYGLESHVAIYPRIVVDPELIGETKLLISKDEKTKLFRENYIVQDKDGLCYINYLHISKALKDPMISCLAFKERAYDKLVESTNNIKVCQKLTWHLNYIIDFLLNLEETDE